MKVQPESLFPEHVTSVQRHWEQALSAEGYAAAVVHSGTPMTSFLDDYEYAFRPNPQFGWWLPLTHHADSVLLIAPGERPRLFYFQPDDFWYLPPSDPASWWADQFDIEVVREADAWRDRLATALPDLRSVAAVGDSPALQGVFAAERINPQGLVDRLHLARTCKTPYELACIEQASRRAAVAHQAAEQAFREGESEFGIHLRYVASCGQSDTELPYHSIVGLNEHSAVLHYQGRDRDVPRERHSFLIDAGATVHGYAADITRSYASGPGAFAEMIDAMDEVQLGLIREIRAGVDYKALHLRAHRDIATVLEQAGVIKVSADDAVASGLSAVFFPHGLGHFLGLQVHDVAGLIDNDASPIPRPEGHPALRLTRVLEAGNVLTVEPGLYFIATLLQRWRRDRDASMIDWDRVAEFAPCGGIRIEDNVVVTQDGCDNLTRRAFAELG